MLRGGAFLTLRQGLGVALNFGGVLLLTRAIGPGNYGLYAAALGVFLFVQFLTQAGIPVYLVRREEEQQEAYHLGFTLLLLLSVGGMLLTILGLPLLERWTRLEDFGPVALGLFLSLPVAQIAQVPLAKLERNLDFRRVAMYELCGLATFYLIALPLAFGGFGAAAPVAGWWGQQTLLLALFCWGANYRPKLHWKNTLARDALSYGFGFSASTWVWQLGQLVNPLIVGRYAGADAVGYVALATRMVLGLSFVTQVMWRLSISALARVQHDRARLNRAVTEGMKLQVLGQGPFLVAFAWVAPWFLPAFFGNDWLPVAQIYPFLALAAMANAQFNLHSSALYVLKKNLEVAIFHVVHIILFAGCAFLLIPRIGFMGYGWAEVAALSSYVVIHFYLKRELGSPAYLLSGVWYVAFALALFAHTLGWWAALGLVGVALWPRTWKEVISYWHELGGQIKLPWRVKGEQ